MLDNSIEPASEPVIRTRTPARKVHTEEIPIREATRAEERAVRRPAEQKAPTDPFADQHNLYTADKGAARVYYSDYQQQSEVMRAKPKEITTKLDDRQTVSMMLDLAQSRGWGSIKIRGDDAFKREVWVQAEVRGMATEGYKPKDSDIQEASRRKAVAEPASRPVTENVVSEATADNARASAWAAATAITTRSGQSTDVPIAQHAMAQ